MNRDHKRAQVRQTDRGKYRQAEKVTHTRTQRQTDGEATGRTDRRQNRLNTGQSTDGEVVQPATNGTQSFGAGPSHLRFLPLLNADTVMPRFPHHHLTTKFSAFDRLFSTLHPCQLFSCLLTH